MARAANILTAIKNEINNDPASRGYAGKTPGAQANLMNDPLSQSPQVFEDSTIDVQLIALELIKRGKWEAVNTAAASVGVPGHVPAYGIVQACALVNVTDKVNIGSIRQAILDLIAAGVLVVGDGNALQTLARKEIKISRSDTLSFGFVTQGDVENALAS